MNENCSLFIVHCFQLLSLFFSEQRTMNSEQLPPAFLILCKAHVKQIYFRFDKRFRLFGLNPRDIAQSSRNAF